MPLPESSDERQATGRERHDQKITVYLSAAELIDLEHARLKLRRFGFVVDRGRLVREAIAVCSLTWTRAARRAIAAAASAASRGEEPSASPERTRYRR